MQLLTILLILFTLANSTLLYVYSRKFRKLAEYILNDGKRKLILDFLENGIAFLTDSTLSNLVEELLVFGNINGGKIEIKDITQAIKEKADVINNEIGKLYKISTLLMKVDNLGKELLNYSRYLKIISIALLTLVIFFPLINTLFQSLELEIIECGTGTDLLAFGYLILLIWIVNRRRIIKQLKEGL